MSIVDYLFSQPTRKGTIYDFSKKFSIATADAIDDLVKAASQGLVSTSVETRGKSRVLTVTLSRKAVRRINREKRDDVIDSVINSLVDTLSRVRPLRIGRLVDLTGHDRSTVLEALRIGRDRGIFKDIRATRSNFHVQWTLNLWNPDVRQQVNLSETGTESEEETTETETTDEIAE